jgi:hypothetical protein
MVNCLVLLVYSVQYVHSWFTGSKAAFGATFRVTGGFQKAGTSSLMRVTGKFSQLVSNFMEAKICEKHQRSFKKHFFDFRTLNINIYLVTISLVRKCAGCFLRYFFKVNIQCRRRPSCTEVWKVIKVTWCFFTVRKKACIENSLAVHRVLNSSHK